MFEKVLEKFIRIISVYFHPKILLNLSLSFVNDKRKNYEDMKVSVLETESSLCFTETARGRRRRVESIHSRVYSRLDERFYLILNVTRQGLINNLQKVTEEGERD